MNNADMEVVLHMIEFIENKEREVQAAKLGKSSKTKVVSGIIKELEGQIKNAH